MDIIVSIMITCYNLQDCIDTAIESVVSQNMPFEWEILVGDDGSTDDTVMHIQKWIKKYPHNIKLFIMPRESDSIKNGTRAARNRANLLRNAKGRYLIFLDGDDQYLGTEKIETQVRFLEDVDHQDCSAVAHNIIAYDVDKNEKHLLADASLKEGAVDKKRYIQELYFHTNTILFRRSCLETLLNEKYIDFLNDNFITFIILQYGDIYYMKAPWAQYNLTGQGLWTGKKKTYGCFRNIILYDLEREMNRSLRFSVLIRHISNFRYLLKNYKTEDRAYIEPLVEELDKKSFHYTFLLFNLNGKHSLNELIELLVLKIKVSAVTAYIHIKRIPVYIKRYGRGRK